MRQIFLFAVVIMFSVGRARADGFELKRALAQDRHATLKLTPEQIELVGRERKLVLNDAQRAHLASFVKRVPKVLGVESPGEPDCSCHISSAMWTATSEVTIWLDRLAYDRDGSKEYYELRRQPGHFTANARGEIFAGGRPIAWPDFVAAVMAWKNAGADRGYLQLSRPPEQPESFRKKADWLWTQKHYYSRL